MNTTDIFNIGNISTSDLTLLSDMIDQSYSTGINIVQRAIGEDLYKALMKSNVKSLSTTPASIKMPAYLNAVVHMPKIDKVIFCPPATIVFWSDGEKTVVKTHGEEFSEEHGLAMAISRRYFGTRSEFLKTVKNAKRTETRKEETPKKKTPSTRQKKAKK